MTGEVKSANEATEIALSFVKKYRIYTRLTKAVREGDVWVVEIDVGLISTQIAKVKVDSKTGIILEYTIP